MLVLKRLMGACVVIAAFALVGSAATEPKAPKEAPAKKPNMVKAEGTVQVVKENNAVTAINLTTASEAYSITLDPKGQKMGEEMNGKKAIVRGVVTEKNGKKWLTVTSYKPVEKVKEKETKK
jgi:hypothetical protein